MTNIQLLNTTWAIGLPTIALPMLYAAIHLERKLRR